MKREFLFGLGAFFYLAVFLGIDEIRRSETVAGINLIMIGLPFCVIAISAAADAPPAPSRQHAVAGWLAAFLCMTTLALVLHEIILSVR